MDERREDPRGTALAHAIQSQAQLPSGQILKGSLHDLSRQGVKIVGDTTGLALGAEVNLMLLLPLDVKVGYRCVVRRIDRDRKSWGANLTSRIWSVPSP